MWAGSSDTQAPHTPAAHTQSRPLDRHHPGAIHFNSLSTLNCDKQGKGDRLWQVGVAVYCCWQRACLAGQQAVHQGQRAARFWHQERLRSAILRPTQHQGIGRKKKDFLCPLQAQHVSTCSRFAKSSSQSRHRVESHVKACASSRGACACSLLLAKVQDSARKFGQGKPKTIQ